MSASDVAVLVIPENRKGFEASMQRFVHGWELCHNLGIKH